MQTSTDRGVRTWLLVTAGYAALTLLYVWPLLGGFGSRLPSDTGDPALNTWILWWNAHAVPLTARWWDAPIFYPLRGTFALSETLLGVAPLTTPLQWMGAGPVAAYNTVFVLSFFTAALAAHALAYQLTGRHAAALVAGVAYGFNPYRAAQIPHLQTLISCWMPLALLGLHRYLDRRRLRDLAIAAGAWTMNGLTTGYFLVFFAVLAALWIAWFVRRRRDLAAILGALALGTLPLVPLLWGYAVRQRAFGVSRGIGEITAFSADLTSVWAASRSLWLSRHWTLAPQPEGEMYPGVIVLGLIILAAAARARRRRRDRSTESVSARAEPKAKRVIRNVLLGLAAAMIAIVLPSSMAGGFVLTLPGFTISTAHPHKVFTTTLWLIGIAAALHPRVIALVTSRSTPLFYGVAACAMFAFALGPFPQAFGVPIIYEGPYALLMQLPGGASLRVPARFNMLVALCLAQAAALAVQRLTNVRPRPALVGLLLLAIGLDSWVPSLRTAPLPHPVDLTAASALPVLEVPAHDLFDDTRAMLRSMDHRHPLINGYSGYGPPHYEILRDGLARFDPGALGAIQELTPFLVFVDRADDQGDKYRSFISGLPEAQPLDTTQAGSLFQLPLRARSDAETDPALRIASITTPQNGAAAPLMNDGNLATRWTTGRTQRSGEQVTVGFDRPVTISGLELDLGDSRLDYPRALRVTVSGEGSAPEVVWEMSTNGPAITATFTDRERMPLRLHFSRPVRGRELTMTLTDGDPALWWSIAELKVFGR